MKGYKMTNTDNKDFFIKVSKNALKIALPCEAKVYLYIASFNSQNRPCYASLSKISEEVNEAKRDVIKALKRLEEKQIIEVERAKAQEGYKNPYNIYKLKEAQIEVKPTIEEIKSVHHKSKLPTRKLTYNNQAFKNKTIRETPEWYEDYEKSLKEASKQAKSTENNENNEKTVQELARELFGDNAKI